jgi:hypothetical protein
MKKIIMLIMVVGFCLVSYAGAKTESWILTNNAKIDCQQIRMGISKARILQPNGKKEIIPVDNINAYSLNGKIYTRLCLYRNGLSCKKMVFMELVKERDGFSLYKYYDQIADTTFDSYYIYREDDYCYALDESFAWEKIVRQFSYFGIRVTTLE